MIIIFKTYLSSETRSFFLQKRHLFDKMTKIYDVRKNKQPFVEKIMHFVKQHLHLLP